MMNSLVKTTYDQLMQRLQRGGTSAKATKLAPDLVDRLCFKVRKDNVNDGDAYVDVEVSLWHQRNVYKLHEDKVQITLSHLAGQQSQFTFFPRIGNCPPVDKVEAKIRESLETLVFAIANDARLAQERQEAERQADFECPLPPASGVWRKRYTDGTYEVKAAIYGLPAEAVRQIIEIEQTRAPIRPPMPPLPPPITHETATAFLAKEKAKRSKTAAPVPEQSNISC